MEGEVIDAKPANATIEDVNTNLLNKLNKLIESVNDKDPEMIRALTESVAKLNTSLKGNNIFTPRETEEERKEREATEAIHAAMNQ